MLQEILRELHTIINRFPQKDELFLNKKKIVLDSKNFENISALSEKKKIAFVDGGQAEILSSGNFCLSFIRVGVLIYSNNKKISEYKHEFYLLTTAKYKDDEMVFESIIFPLNGEKLIDEQALYLSADATIKKSTDRIPIAEIANIARRFAELALAAKTAASAEIIIMDGTLDCSYPNEEKYLSKLPANACALAKSSSLFTVSGNSPMILLQKLGPINCWSYGLDEQNYFVKLHQKAKHVFRFTGNKDFLPALVENSKDAIFLGYPYGLIAADKFARVSNEEKKSLRMNLLLRAESAKIVEYLSTTNAHDILDNLG
ncbi:hypothetical protein HYV87_03855 [Candidatus Woesearchaeota archaeon]|nr:hypothetical protein [Candidatus Woesearchaeota archaeon]